MPDPTSVCNEALGELGHSPIFSFTDGTSISTLCGEHYPTSRDATLELAPWNFAKRRVWLARLADAPPFGWASMYSLPPDYIKARGTDQDEECFGPPGWDIEINDLGHRVVVSNEERVGLVYTARIEDLNLWSPLARQVLVKMLASRLAKAITGQNSTQEQKLKEMVGMLSEGKRSDGREGTPKVLAIPPRMGIARHARGGGPLRYPRSATFD